MPLASPRLSTQTHSRQNQAKQAWWRLLAIATLGCGLVTSTIAMTADSAVANERQNDLTEGVYAFGESPTPGQPGTTYMVLRVEADQVTGGFYQPASSFDCFYGEITDAEMALTVIDSYAQTEHPFVVALENQTTVASQDAIAGEWIPSGFHALPDLSDTDRQVLETCSR